MMSLISSKMSDHLETSSVDTNNASVVVHTVNYMFGLVGFYGISTIVGYLMPNPLDTHILNIYDLVGLGFMAYQPLKVI